MKRVFVMNGGTSFYVIDQTDGKLLLQRCIDGEFVIAHGYRFRTDSTVWWNRGSYYKDNLLGAVKAFYGEGEGRDGI